MAEPKVAKPAAKKTPAKAVSKNPSKKEPKKALASSAPVASSPAPVKLKGMPPAPNRQMSLRAIAMLLDRDRAIVERWIREGCPVVQRPATSAESWVLDVSAVVRWLEGQAARSAAEASDETPSKGSRTAKEKDPKWQRAMIQLAKDAGAVAIIDDILSVCQRRNSMLQQTLMAIPDLLAREMAGFPQERIQAWRLKARDRTREALEEASRFMVDNLPDEPLIEEDGE